MDYYQEPVQLYIHILSFLLHSTLKGMFSVYSLKNDIRTSDSLNEGLPIKITREKFQRK